MSASPLHPTRPIMRYHGGKWRLAPWIISYFPEHRCYVEPFGGAASVLIQKPKSKVEVINDKYSRIVNAYRVLRDEASSQMLAELIALTPYSEEEYRACREISEDPIEDARRMIVLGHQAHGSTGASGGKLSGWRRGVRAHGGSSADEWLRIADHIERWAERLRGVYIENADALNVMKRWDSPDALHYIDPPYVASTRHTGSRGYAHEMSDEQHRELASTLESLSGMVIVSGYPSVLYQELFRDWIRIERNHVADKGIRSTDVIWLRNIPGK